MLALHIQPGLTLRPLTPWDASRFFAHIAAEREHLLDWVPDTDAVLCEEDAHQWLVRAAERGATGRGLFGGLFLERELIGTAGLHHLDRADGTTEIGYWLGQGWTGRGYMTATVRALVAYIFGELRLNRVEIVCPESNARSRAIPERLGFTLEGVRRQAMMVRGWPHDLCHYGLLASEWRTFSPPGSLTSGQEAVFGHGES